MKEDPKLKEKKQSMDPKTKVADMLELSDKDIVSYHKKASISNYEQINLTILCRCVNLFEVIILGVC